MLVSCQFSPLSYVVGQVNPRDKAAITAGRRGLCVVNAVLESCNEMKLESVLHNSMFSWLPRVC